MPEISIIVPVYKVENYLSRCIDSILAQTFEDFELILVDDGSPDKCGEICDTYAAKDARIKVIHKKNGGLSDARNAGLDIAVGNYIGFVDSDDYIENDMYETLYNNIIMHHCDISVCGIFHCYRNSIVCKRKKQNCKIYNRKQIIEGVLSGKISTANVCNKLYKAKLFSEVSYPVGCLFEDAFVIIDILLQIERVVVDTSPKYYYLHRENSITTQKFTRRDYDIVLAYLKNLDLIKKYHSDLVDAAYYRYWWAHFHLINRLALDTKQNRKSFIDIPLLVKNVFKKYIRCILKNPYQSVLKKGAYCLIMISPDFYMNLYHFWFYNLRNLRK